MRRDPMYWVYVVVGIILALILLFVLLRIVGVLD